MCVSVWAKEEHTREVVMGVPCVDEEMVFSFTSEESDGGIPSPPRMSFAHELFPNGGSFCRLRRGAGHSSYSAPASPSPLHHVNHALFFSPSSQPHQSSCIHPSLTPYSPSHATKPTLFRRWCSLSALKRALFHIDAPSRKLSPSPSFRSYHQHSRNAACTILPTMSTDQHSATTRKLAHLLHHQQTPTLKNPKTNSLNSRKGCDARNDVHGGYSFDNSSKIHNRAKYSSTHKASAMARGNNFSSRELFMTKTGEPSSPIVPKGSKDKDKPIVHEEKHKKGNKFIHCQTRAANYMHCSRASMYQHDRHYLKVGKSNVECSSPSNDSIIHSNFSSKSVPSSQPNSPLCSYHDTLKPNSKERRKTLLPYRQVFFDCLGFNMEHSYSNTYNQKEFVY